MKDSPSNELLLMSLTRFYRENMDGIKSVLPILQKTSPISLRLIDWFVTNYCKKYKTVISNRNNKFFNVYSNYRSQLKAFKKTQFDPFRRRDRIDFYYDTNMFIETTIGQLNFFRWFIENNLLTYITKHCSEIESDMIHNNSSIMSSYEKNKMSTKSLICNMSQYQETTIINFT